MAKGYDYHEESETYIPSRPSRRRDSHRGENNYGYSTEYSSRTAPSAAPRHRHQQGSAYEGGHYAESPIIMPTAERTLEIVSRGDRHGGSSSLRRASSDGYALHKEHASRRSSTLPSGERSIRSRSRPSRAPGGPTTLSKVKIILFCNVLLIKIQNVFTMRCQI